MTRPSALTVAVVVPAVATLAGVVATALLAAGAADPVAVHWGPSGEADGFASPGSVVVVTAVTGLGLTLLFGLLLLASGVRPGRTTARRRVVAAAASGVTSLVVTLGIWMLATQPPGAEPPAIGAGLGLAFATAAVVGTGAWFLTAPGVPDTTLTPRAGRPVTLAADERAAWVGTARMARGALLALGATVLAVLAITAVAVFQTGGTAWPVLLIPAGLGVVLFVFGGFTVRVDARGLTVRALLGLPVWRIRADDVAQAAVVEVAPLGDFGGWGIRFGRGRRTGVVTRAGEALEVRRRSGRALVVTVDDAEAAAGLLAAIAERARPTAR
ncbi:DUF1648 domain-containing protein [Pseudolysinimonas sp.]